MYFDTLSGQWVNWSSAISIKILEDILILLHLTKLYNLANKYLIN